MVSELNIHQVGRILKQEIVCPVCVSLFVFFVFVFKPHTNRKKKVDRGPGSPYKIRNRLRYRGNTQPTDILQSCMKTTIHTCMHEHEFENT